MSDDAIADGASEKKAVFAAADALKALGDEVTLDAVSVELGGGEAAEILPVLQEWRIRQAMWAEEGGDIWARIVAGLGPLTDDLRMMTAAAAEHAKQRAQAEAADAAEEAGASAAAAIRVAAEEQVAEAREDLAAAQARIAELESQAQPTQDPALEAELADARARIALLEDEAQSHAEMIGAMEEAAAHSAPPVDDGRVSELEAALAAAKTANDELQRARDAAQAQTTRERHRAETAEAQLTQVATLRDETADTLAESMRARLTAEEESDGLHDRIAALEAALADAQAAEQEATKAAEELAAGIDGDQEWRLSADDWPELPRQLAIAAARTSALRAERDALREHLQDAQGQIDRLNGMLEIKLSAPTTIVQTGGGEGEAVGGAPAGASRSGGGRARLSVVRK